MTSWSDHALSNIDDDRLDRRRLVGSLADLLSGAGLETPLVVGIYGDWGSGKTSVMDMLRSQLKANGGDKTICLWFDAWKFARTEHSLWRALLLAVIDALGEELPKTLRDQDEKDKLKETLNELQERLFRSLTIKEKGDLQVNWGEALPLTVDVGLRLMTAGLGDKLGIGDWVKGFFGKDSEEIDEDDAKKAAALIERTYAEQYHAQITAIDQFEKALSKLIDKQLVERGYRLTVFVDDLDRCLPEDAIAALEAIKLFFDMRGCVFILGMDREVVERGILSRFPPIETIEGVKEQRVDPRSYLDKIVQIPVTLPPPTEKQVGTYLDALFERDGIDDHLKNCRDMIEVAAPPNPRTLKRVLNVLALLLPLQGGGSTAARCLAKVVLLQVVFDDAYAMVQQQPLAIKDFERGADGQNVEKDVKDLLERLPALRELMKVEPKLADLTDEVVKDLIAQAEITRRSFGSTSSAESG